MSNKEKKQQIWSEISKKFSHLEGYCTIELNGIDDNSNYFHPHFILNEDTYITSQCDVGNNHIYATRFNSQNFNVEIYEGLLEAIIVGFYTNKEKVYHALSTLTKVRNHINEMNGYVTEYITNLLIGNSIEEVSKSLINEIKTANEVVKHIK